MPPVGSNPFGPGTINNPTQTDTVATPFGCDSIWNRWDCDFGTPPPPVNTCESENFTLFMGDWYGQVWAIRALTGEVRWKTDALFGNEVTYGLDVVDNYVVAGMSANRFQTDFSFAPVVILDITTGDEIRRFPTATAQEQADYDPSDSQVYTEVNSLIVDPNNYNIYVALWSRFGSDTSTRIIGVRAFDFEGNHLWSTHLDDIGYIPNALAFNGDYNIVAPGQDATLPLFTILDKDTGDVIFAHTPIAGTDFRNQADTVVSSPDGGFIISTGIGGSLQRYDKDGGFIWDSPVFIYDEEAHMTPSISTDGEYVVIANDAYNWVSVSNYETGEVVAINITQSHITGFEGAKLSPDCSLLVKTHDDWAEYDLVMVDFTKLVEDGVEEEIWRLSAVSDLDGAAAYALRFGMIPE